MLGLFKAAKPKDKAAESERKLTEAFGAIGMNFMRLHPVMHNALLKEAIATSSEETMEIYLKAIEALVESPGTDNMKGDLHREGKKVHALGL